MKTTISVKDGNKLASVGQNTVLIKDVSAYPTESDVRTVLDNALVAIITLGDARLSNVKERLVAGETLISAGRSYRVVNGPGQFKRWLDKDVLSDGAKD